MNLGALAKKFVGDNIMDRGRNASDYDDSDEDYEEAESEEEFPPKEDFSRPGGYGRNSSAASGFSGFGSTDFKTKSPSVSSMSIGAVNKQKIKMFSPTAYNEVRKIGEFYKEGYQIVLQLDKTKEREDVRRMVDFFIGLAFGLGGEVRPTGGLSYLIVPANCEFVDESVVTEERGGSSISSVMHDIFS